jgi:hypothetical protein
MTIFSPNSVGSVETRKSIARLADSTSFHPAVLRHAALGNVELRDDLDPGGQLFLDRQRRLGHFACSWPSIRNRIR